MNCKLEFIALLQHISNFLLCHLQILQQNLADMQQITPGQRIVFVQDNCSIHVAAAAREWFQDHEDALELLPWPAKSPDLNPIENLWASMVRAWEDVGYNGVRERTVPQLTEHVLEVWNHHRHGDGCSRLVNSMRKRLLECIDNNGYYSHY